ncbi:hypothetical protein BC833DRAFT_647655 [Globomyces pollinis-pini]|nr:hypothetical protein BC833DRAFT_647655 [Globomyces pollinis-pini]
MQFSYLTVLITLVCAQVQVQVGMSAARSVHLVRRQGKRGQSLQDDKFDSNAIASSEAVASDDKRLITFSTIQQSTMQLLQLLVLFSGAVLAQVQVQVQVQVAAILHRRQGPPSSLGPEDFDSNGAAAAIKDTDDLITQ